MHSSLRWKEAVARKIREAKLTEQAVIWYLICLDKVVQMAYTRNSGVSRGAKRGAAARPAEAVLSHRQLLNGI